MITLDFTEYANHSRVYMKYFILCEAKQNSASEKKILLGASTCCSIIITYQMLMCDSITTEQGF